MIKTKIKKGKSLNMKKPQRNKLNLNSLVMPLLALSLMAGCAGLLGGKVSAATITTTVPVIPASDDPEIIMGNKPSGMGATMAIPTDNTITTVNADGFEFSTWRINVASICQEAEIKSLRVISNSTAVDPNDDEDGVMLFAYTNSGGTMLAIHQPNYTIAIGDTLPPSSGQDIGPYRGSKAGSGTLNIAGPMDVTYKNLAVGTSSIVGIGILNDASNTTTSITSSISSAEIVYDDTACPDTNSAPTITSPSPVTIPSTTASGSTVLTGTKLNAADANGDTLSYSIVYSNESNYFSIDSATGDIKTAMAGIPAGPYVLMVRVSDGHGGESDAHVIITVEDVVTDAGGGGSSPSVSNSTAGAPAVKKQTKPMLANSGQNMSALAVISATLLSLVGYFKIKNNKKNQSYIKR